MLDYDNEPVGMGCAKTPDPRENYDDGESPAERKDAARKSYLARLEELGGQIQYLSEAADKVYAQLDKNGWEAEWLNIDIGGVEVMIEALKRLATQAAVAGDELITAVEGD